MGCHPLQRPSKAAAHGTERVSLDAIEGGDERWTREKGESEHQGVGKRREMTVQEHFEKFFDG